MLTHNNIKIQETVSNALKSEASDASGCTLGIYTTSSSAPASHHIENRTERFKALSFARKIFTREGRALGLEHPINFHRTAKCNHVRLSTTVGILRHITGKASYEGLMQCGSVWSCPVCAAKVQEKRKQEVSSFFHQAYAVQRKKVVMVTLTFPHNRHQSLSDLLDLQARAFKSLRGGRAYSRFKESIGFGGMIRGLEVTRSLENGWHPHTHELYIVDSDVSASFIKNEVLRLWSKACVNHGLVNTTKQLDDFYRHSVDVHDNARSGDYLIKIGQGAWGADSEITKQSNKTKKNKSMTPFELLVKSEGVGKFAKYYLEYVQAMRCKRQLYWSTGLKKLCGLTDKTDLQLVNEKQKDTTELCRLSRDQWRYIATNKLQAEYLTRFELFESSHVLNQIQQAIDNNHLSEIDCTSPSKKCGHQNNIPGHRPIDIENIINDVMKDNYNHFLFMLAKRNAESKAIRDAKIDENRRLNYIFIKQCTKELIDEVRQLDRF